MMSRHQTLRLALTTCAALMIPGFAGAQQVETVIDGIMPPAPPAIANPWSDNEVAAPAIPVAQPAAPELPRKIPDALQERAIWEAAADGDWAKVEDLIRRRQSLVPGWKAPAALNAMRVKDEAARRIEEASAASEPKAVIAAAAEVPDAFSCLHANNLWRLAEAHIALGDKESALALYRKAAADCPAAERYAAIEKARAIAPLATIVEIIDAEGAAKDPREEATRAEIVQAIADMNKKSKPDPMAKMMAAVGKAVDSATPNSPLPEIYAAAADKADAKKSAKLAELIGWLQQKRGDNAAAAAWFRKAVDWGAGSEAKKGLIYAIAATGEAGRQQAEAYAMLWPGLVSPTAFAKNPDLVAFEAAREARDWQACLKLADKVQGDVAVRTSAAWCAYEAGDAKGALASFKAIASDTKLDKARRIEAAKGWTVSARKAGDSASPNELSSLGLLPADDAKKLGYEIGIALYWELFNHKNYRAALARIQDMARAGLPLSDEERVSAGWAAYNSGACSIAGKIFNTLTASENDKVRKEAAKGVRTLRGNLRAEEPACGKNRSTNWYPANQHSPATQYPNAQPGDPLL